MGAAAIELRNCVVRKDYTVSYAAMTVYDGMTLSSFPVVEPMVVGVWQLNFYRNRQSDPRGEIIHRETTRRARPRAQCDTPRARDSGARTGPGRPQAASRPCEAPRVPRFFFRDRSDLLRKLAIRPIDTAAYQLFPHHGPRVREPANTVFKHMVHTRLDRRGSNEYMYRCSHARPGAADLRPRISPRPAAVRGLKPDRV